MCLDDKIILEIQRSASLLNTNKLSFEEYVAHGGKFEKQIIDLSSSSSALITSMPLVINF